MSDSRARLRCLSLALLGASLSLGCSSEGTTPNCPELSLYRIRDAAEKAAHEAERQQAAARGCVTLPSALDAEGGASGQ